MLYTQIQLEQLSLLSTMFCEGEVKVLWLPSKLNIADLVTRAPVKPVQLVNSNYYQYGVLPDGVKLCELFWELSQNITFVTITNGLLCSLQGMIQIYQIWDIMIPQGRSSRREEKLAKGSKVLLEA